MTARAIGERGTLVVGKNDTLIVAFCFGEDQVQKDALTDLRNLLVTKVRLWPLKIVIYKFIGLDTIDTKLKLMPY
jgi:hypothetical protein